MESPTIGTDMVVTGTEVSADTMLVNFTTMDTPVCVKWAKPLTGFIAVLVFSIGLFTFGSNTLVIVSFATVKNLRTFGNYFILNLAIADLIVGALICVYTPYFVSGCWPLTRPGCLAFNTIDYVVPLASTWNMAVISLDRFCSVAKPIQYRLKKGTSLALGLMTVPWTVGFLLYGPSVIFWSTWTGRQAVPDHLCYVEFFDNADFLLFASTIEFVIPFFTVSTLNVLIYVNIRRRSRSLCDHRGKADDKKKEALARDKRSARSLAILVGVFFITWAPYEICALINPLCDFCVPDQLFEVTFWFLWLNSFVNPLLYPFLQRRFRIAFIRILSCGRVKVGHSDDAITISNTATALTNATN